MMTAFVIAVGIFSLISGGAEMGFALAGHRQMKTPAEYGIGAVTWLIMAAGAGWVLLS